jgi:hypothetical protein
MSSNETSPQSLVDASIRQRSSILIFLLVLATAFAAPRWVGTSHAQVILPVDAQPRCAPDAGSWFDQHGFVQPPDNVQFPSSSDPCIFLETSMRMFLWVTSVYRRQDNEPIYVYDSPSFFRVGEPDKRGYRRLFQNNATRTENDDKSARSFGPGISQFGPLNKPVVFDNQGEIHDFVHYSIIQRGARDPCKNDISSVKIRGGITSLGSSGARVVNGAGTPVSSIIVNGVTTYFDADGKVVVSTAGQVCNKLLLSRESKIVYYNIAINDVYAYFVTGFKNKQLHFSTFPTGADVPTPTGSTKDITEIKQFAESHGSKLLDEKALAVELKTAWIEIDDRDMGRFVTTRAMVPTFIRNGVTHWRADCWKSVRLGLVGMHVVFSARSHPQMIWATFEHVDNAPNDKYQYCQPSQDTQCTKVNTHWRDKSTNWVFSANDSLSGDRQLAYLCKGDICGYNKNAIGPNNILREHPWGSTFGSVPAAEFNTDTINVNNSVLNVLPHGDVRKNYVLMGSMWTQGGLPGGVEFGPQRLTNTTMETFFQDSNCFDCHRAQTGTGMSHIFNLLRPLFGQQRMTK